jgi:DNA adenine methylase
MADPFLKWAGGKRWLVQRFPDLFPRTFGRYIEPFLGSGAVYFYLQPMRALLSDSNPELVNAYSAVKESPQSLHRILKRYQSLHCLEFYCKVRAKRPKTAVSKAARFIYLNRTCFNGLYRENRRGVFNVPMGSKNAVEFPAGFLSTVGTALKAATIKVSDFECAIDQAGRGDFIYADPPYTVMHNNNNFIKYNAKLFSWSDQIRLAESLKRAGLRGAYVMLSNADHECVRSLYRGFGAEKHLLRSSVLASESYRRCKTTELLVRNFG